MSFNFSTKRPQSIVPAATNSNIWPPTVFGVLIVTSVTTNFTYEVNQKPKNSMEIINIIITKELFKLRMFKLANFFLQLILQEIRHIFDQL